jgi:membrane protein implicated in regulation of membrane protease activity
MDWAMLARWEWALMLLLVLALAVLELVAVRRAIRRARRPPD